MQVLLVRPEVAYLRLSTMVCMLPVMINDACKQQAHKVVTGVGVEGGSIRHSRPGSMQATLICQIRCWLLTSNQPGCQTVLVANK